ncbi:MAG: ABC transporter ATP-binding protein, partial [Erysipelotrichaceae bacterium]
MAQFFSGTAFIIDLLNVVVLLAGGIYTYQGIINYGDLVAYMLFINMFISPIKKLIDFMEQYQNGMTGFKRFAAIIGQEVEEEGKVKLNNVEGKIKFDKV